MGLIIGISLMDPAEGVLGDEYNCYDMNRLRFHRHAAADVWLPLLGILAVRL